MTEATFPKKSIKKTRSARLAELRSRMKTRKVDAQQPDEVTVQRGMTSDGYVVYGSPAKPRHISVEKIRRAVLAVKA